MILKEKGVLGILALAIEKLKGKWINAIFSSLILVFLVFVLTGLLNVNSIFALPLLGFAVVGQITFTRKLLSEGNYNLEDIFADYKLFLTATLSLALFMVATLFGLLLLIVPGIIMLINYSFCLHSLEDNKNLKALEALKASKDLVKGVKGKVILFYLAFLLILIIAFGIGLLFALPINLIWGSGLIVGGGLIMYASIIFGVISAVFIYPYFIASLTLFYDQLKDYNSLKNQENEKEEQEKVNEENIEVTPNDVQ